MSKKAVIILSVIIAAVIGVTVLVFVPRDAVIVTTSSSLLSTSYSFYDTNPLLKIKLWPSSSVNHNDLDQIRAEKNAALEESFEFVLNNDDQAFSDEFTSLGNEVFELGDYIYYFRTSDTKHVYKISKSTGKISSCELSGYNGFSGSGWNERETEVTHNYTAFVSITTEGLIDSYPELKSRIEELDGNFYYNYTYVDNGRIFFEKKCTIYEFMPSDGTIRKVVSVKADETVEMVLDKR